MRKFVLHGIKGWVFTDNDMVDNFYVEELCAFSDLLGDLDVIVIYMENNLTFLY